MKYYVVNFSGGEWTNDNVESPYYCGVYSSKKIAQKFVEKAMKEELYNSDCVYNDDGDEVNVEPMSFTKLSSFYDNNMGCYYEIHRKDSQQSNIQYTIDYRPSGGRHEFLGVYSSLNEVKNMILSRLKTLVNSKNL